jgi:hypothetical protein
MDISSKGDGFAVFNADLGLPIKDEPVTQEPFTVTFYFGNKKTIIKLVNAEDVLCLADIYKEVLKSHDIAFTETIVS